MTIPLIKLKRWPTLERHLKGRNVLIWSGEHRAWWRGGAAGYTTDRNEAGVYDFNSAFARSSHCGPEKQIIYETV
jgi:hypothetical protein